jgi:hypothetical protein
MAQTLNLKISGLYTNPNQFSEIPEGALQRADNIQIDKGSVAEPRRGQAKYGQLPSGYTGSVDALYDYQGTLLVSYDNKLARDNGSGTFTAYSGTYSPPSGHRIKSTQANKNFYFTTSANIKKLDNIANTPIDSGVARALDGYFQSFAAGGFLSNSQSVAYRFVWSFRDANDNLLIGSPSGRLIVSNSGSGSNQKITLRLYIPDSITTDYFFQAYRSVIVSSTIEPPDDLQLVYEGTITNTDKANGYVDFEDITPESLRGAFLYTSPTQEGILQSNDEPPFSVDLCTYKNMTFYANTKGRQNFFLTLISATGSAPGLVLGDTITINGITYTASASEVPASGNFLLVTSGTASSNISDTTRSLVKVINIRDANLSAYYISGFNELPGKIWIQANNYSTSVFYVTAATSGGSQTGCWNPVLQTSGTDNSSTNDENPNRIFFSKIQQPESVPILNYVDAGSRGNEILRIIPLRDSVFVLKEDGVYRIIGEDPSSLRISLFDNTIKLLSLESAVEMNNQIYCYTDQGIAAISDNGVQVLSRPIEDQIQQKEIIQNFFTNSFGVSYEVDRKYLFYCKALSTDSNPSEAYVFNFFTNAWTKYIQDRSCGIVYDNRLYMGGVDGHIYRERKALNSTDYVDNSYNITINSINGNVLTVASATNIAINQVIRQSGVFSVVTDVTGNNVTLESSAGFVAGAAISYEPIESILEWSQNDSQNPGILKHWREITMLFRTADFSSIEIGFSSNFDPNVEYTEVSPIRSDQWGSFQWGNIPWGFGTGLAYPIRTYIPLLKRRASWVFFRVRSKKAQSYFAIQGLSAMFEPMSERFK